MKKLILASLLLAGSTDKLREQQAQASGRYSMHCERIRGPGSGWMKRCVNSEAVCYEKYEAMSCFRRR
jgi:hypothetical protein